MKKQDSRFTYADYLEWDDGKRWEIIHGEAYNMSPAPGTAHQLIVTQLIRLLGDPLENLKCNVFTAPFDVTLPLGAKTRAESDNVVQPDVSVVCDASKLDEKGCFGAPELIIEVLSPHSYRRDKLEKFNLYEEAGVKEYWLVSQSERLVEVFVLGPDGRYGRPEVYDENGTITLTAVKDVTIDLKKVFKDKVGS